MYEEKDHLCTGTNCIFCRIFTFGNSGTGTRSLIVEQTLSKIKEVAKPDKEMLANLKNDQVHRLEAVERLAFYDSLTGICNTHAFMRELQEEVIRAQRYNRPLSICIVMVDQFTQIKRSYGLLGAEAVLKHVAGILKESLRGVDMAARYQDDKFAALLPETNNAGVLIAAERLAKRFASRPVKLNVQNINISVSIGIATFLKHGRSRDEMITAALAAISSLAT